MAFSKLEKVLLAKLGVDVARTPIARKAAYRIALQAARIVAPATVPVASALGPITPYGIGAGLGYAALQTDPGQQLLAAAEERGRQDRLKLERMIQDTMTLAPIKVKKKASGFNQAVKAGMKAVRLSKSYGAKGKISNSKKAFAAVTRAVSRLSRGGKTPKSGISRQIALAAKPVMLKTMKKVRKGDKVMYQGNIGR
jgi:hypothetical protein